MIYLRRCFLLVSVIGILLTPGQVTAQPAAPQVDPGAVVRAIFVALNSGDVDGALAYVADDAVLTFSPPPPGVNPSLVGKAEIRTWWETFVGWHPETEIIDLTVKGNMVMMTSYVSEDGFRALGVAPMRSELVAIVQEGLLRAYTVTFSKESQAKLAAALDKEAKKEIIRRFYDELWNQGDMSFVDTFVAADFEDGFSGQVGQEPLKGTVELFRTAFPTMQISYGDMMVDGDMVVVTITNTMGAYAGGLPDFFGIPDSAIGKEVVLHGIDYARIVDGKMVKGWGVHDDLGWLQQFGLALQAAEE
ncbi:MAG: nuclear transport factor 2 family protein [Caldilineaceae bacterium]